jgi:hypothetical protein
MPRQTGGNSDAAQPNWVLRRLGDRGAGRSDAGHHPARSSHSSGTSSGALGRCRSTGAGGGLPGDNSETHPTTGNATTRFLVTCGPTRSTTPTVGTIPPARAPRPATAVRRRHPSRSYGPAARVRRGCYGFSGGVTQKKSMPAPTVGNPKSAATSGGVAKRLGPADPKV